MSTKRVADGHTIVYSNASGADIAAGDVIDFGSHIAVAHDLIKDTEDGAAYVDGVFRLAAETGTAWAQGDDLFWDGSELTKTSLSNTPAGVAHEAKASAAALGKVRLTAPSPVAT